MILHIHAHQILGSLTLIYSFRGIDILNILSSIVSKGVGAQLLKVGSKRRRTKAQIKAEKEAEEAKQSEVNKKIARISQLEAQIDSLQNQANQGKAAADLMSQFMNAGLVQQTSDHSFLVHGSHGDRSFKAFTK